MRIKNEIQEPIKSGYIFGGWYFDSGFEISVTDNFYLNGNKTLYAKWGQEFDISFDTQGGNEIASIKSKPFEENSLDGKTPTKRGNKFLGWFYDEECTVKFNSSLPITEDFLLHAGWQDTFILHTDTISEAPT